MQPKESRLTKGMTEFGMSLFLPCAVSMFYIVLSGVGNLGLIAVLGCSAAFVPIIALAMNRDFRFLDYTILAIWALECMTTFNHHISVTRTTVLITAIVWGAILIKPSIRSMKEMIDTIEPKGAIF